MDYIKNIFSYSPESPLLFTQADFWIFFGLVFALYSILYKHKLIRNSYLFFISLFFYYKTSGLFFFLLIFSTVVDYTLGLLIFNESSKNKKKLYVFLSVLTNLLVLFYFKYSYFFVENLNLINSWLNKEFNLGLSTNFVVVDYLSVMGNALGGNFNINSIILPVGISFYTFQTISYSVDLYRGKLDKPVKDILDFGFYVSFFPQLVAGPIVRASEFVPQLYKKYQLTKAEFNTAVFLILNGLMKKMIISDYISINFVDRVFADPHLYGGFENLMAVYGYAIQIYCDFSGYTDIAIGVALLMGFKLPLNFNSPYKAANITDFWRRWHISLSSWLRDYLYISLGGNRKGKLKTYRNLFITMLLGGLWHGAAVRFVIWGGLHGIGLAFHKIFILKFPVNKNTKKNYFVHFISVFITFHFVSYAWIYFRANSMEKVNTMLHKIFFEINFNLIPQIISAYKAVFILILMGFIIHWLPVSFKKAYQNWFFNRNLVAKILIIVLVAFTVYQAKSGDFQPFIYFQF